MPVDARQRRLLILVCLCLAALGLDRWVASPLLRLWKERAARIVELDRSIDHGSQLVSRQGQLESRWSEMCRRTRSTGDSAAENQVLNAVSQWAAASGLTVTSLKPRRIDEEDCAKLEVRVAATGTLASIVRFLYELEADPEALKVEEVSMTSRDAKGASINCDVRFTRLQLDENKMAVEKGARKS